MRPIVVLLGISLFCRDLGLLLDLGTQIHHWSFATNFDAISGAQFHA